jgi:AcrR family transcriptional regulator
MPTIRDKVIDAALIAVTDRGWRRTHIDDVIEAAGVSEALFYREFDGLVSVMVAASRQLNAAMADAVADFEEQDSTREKLFALIMARFDAAMPWRAAIVDLARSAPTDPVLAAAAGQALMTMASRALSLAGITVSGPLGFARVNAFMLSVILPAARIWLKDESADLSKTMTGLNDLLERAEWVASRSGPLSGLSGGNISGAMAADEAKNPAAAPKALVGAEAGSDRGTGTPSGSRADQGR